MNEAVVIAIISAGFAAFINCVFQIVNRAIDLFQSKRNEKKGKEKTVLKEREAIYIAALDRLLFIRRGFDFTVEQLASNDILQKEWDESNERYTSIPAKMRLYASDKVFREFLGLLVFSRYSFSPASCSKLAEESKWAFNTQITLLAQHMQEDLGIREYGLSHDVIKCPKCGAIHDISEPCPKCNMSYEGLLHRLDYEIQKEHSRF